MSKEGSCFDLQNYYPKELEIFSISEDAKEITLFMKSCSVCYTCPNCGCKTDQFHGTHRRKVQDLPMLGKCVMLYITLHEFQCINPNCSTSSISENFHGFLNAYSRMTERLVDFILTIALETSCEATARILKTMKIKISGDTVIRLLLNRYSKQESPICGARIGIDDFAYKKRHTYGTVIVEEETHQVIAILDGRDGNTLKEWLKQNKQVTTITRDRANAYTKAIEEVLPNAIQIADRFHLHQNLLEAVRKVMEKEIPVTTSISLEDNSIQIKSSSHEKAVKKTTENVKGLTNAEKTRFQRILQIQELSQEGYSSCEIARRIGIDRRTVTKYRTGNIAILCRSHKRSCLHAYKDLIINHLQNGLTQAEIIRQLRKLGYQKTNATARSYINQLCETYKINVKKYTSLPTTPIGENNRIKIASITKKHIFESLWMNRKLNLQHYQIVWEKYEVLPQLETCIREFRAIFSKRSIPLLYLFIEKYKQSTLKEIARFANGLEIDIEAVENAVVSDLSNGFVEGMNNKIKTIKRTMYGRCKPLLLKAKLMYQIPQQV